MKIRFLKQWRNHTQVGQVRELPDGVANVLIGRHIAEPYEEPVRETAAIGVGETAALKPAKRKKAC